jgi:hypothetical protein
MSNSGSEAIDLLVRRSKASSKARTALYLVARGELSVTEALRRLSRLEPDLGPRMGHAAGSAAPGYCYSKKLGGKAS